MEQAELRVADKAGAALAFGILFTPNAIVLTRDSVHPPTPTGYLAHKKRPPPRTLQKDYI